MKTIVKLRSQFTDAGGGTTYPGEKIGVNAETARRLIKSGAAVAVNISPGMAIDGAPVAELVKRATKPVTDTPALKGFAKLAYLRERIRSHGAKPTGRTIAAMTDQLAALGG